MENIIEIIGILFAILILYWGGWAIYRNEKREKIEDKAFDLAYDRWIVELKKEGLTILKHGKDYPNYKILGEDEWLYDQSLGPGYGVEEVEGFVYFEEYQRFEDLLYQFKDEELQKLYYPEKTEFFGYRKMPESPEWPGVEMYELIDKNDHTKSPMFIKLKKDPMV